MNEHRHQAWLEGTIARVKHEAAAGSRKRVQASGRVTLRKDLSTEVFALPGIGPAHTELQVLLNVKNPDAYVFISEAKVMRIAGDRFHLEAAQRYLKPDIMSDPAAQEMLMLVASARGGPVEGWFLEIQAPETPNGERRLGEWQKVEGAQGPLFIERW